MSRNGKTSDFSRLVFLASELHIAIPSAIVKNVHQGDLIQSIASEGLHGAASTYSISVEQLENLRWQGSQVGPASEQEYRNLLVKQAVLNLEENRHDIHITKYMAMMRQVTDFYFIESGNLIENESVALDEIHNIELGSVDRFGSGFEPFDMITGGFYQGIFMMTGKTGHGKTTAMLALMKYLRQNNMVDEQIFYETEIPLKMMKYKLRMIKDVFSSKDILRCGHANIDMMIEHAKENPNPNRVIYIDSPDVMAGGTGEGKRFYLESIYRKLIMLKDLSKMVVVASQAKQKGNDIELESASDSFDKTRYTDCMMGWKRLRVLPDGYSIIRVNTPKNRFGLPDQAVTFQFDYNTFDYRLDGSSKDDLIDVDEEDDTW